MNHGGTDKTHLCHRYYCKSFSTILHHPQMNMAHRKQNKLMLLFWTQRNHSFIYLSTDTDPVW